MWKIGLTDYLEGTSPFIIFPETTRTIESNGKFSRPLAEWISRPSPSFLAAKKFQDHLVGHGLVVERFNPSVILSKIGRKPLQERGALTPYYNDIYSLRFQVAKLIIRNIPRCISLPQTRCGPIPICCCSLPHNDGSIALVNIT